jgi:hypothetical protein
VSSSYFDAPQNKLTDRSAGRPKEYAKGPDLASKSDRTKRRYRALLRDQVALDRFGFTVNKGAVRSAENRSDDQDLSSIREEINLSPQLSPIQIHKRSATPPVCRHNESGDHAPNPFPISTPVPVREESITPPPLSFDDIGIQPWLSTPVRIREESLTPAPLLFNDPNPPQVSTPIREESLTPPLLSFDSPRSKKRSHDQVEDNTGGDPKDLSAEDEADEEDAWEDEFRETVKAQVEIRDWKLLRNQIKADLKKQHSNLPLSQINQLMILRNFATLRLKGVGRIGASEEIAQQWDEKSDGSGSHFARRIRALARHYQIFEQLPVEHRGGSKNARSLLKDETIRAAARTWLTEQIIGSITPQNFAHGLNTKILPSLNITLKKPLCERTARRWLVKLGWSRTMLRKGVYMDGHEREDVVKYRETVFLPAMKEFERRMVRFEGPELKWVEPVLEPGERILITEFHDESCCQQNEHRSSAW